MKILKLLQNVYVLWIYEAFFVSVLVFVSLKKINILMVR